MARVAAGPATQDFAAMGAFHDSTPVIFGREPEKAYEVSGVGPTLGMSTMMLVIGVGLYVLRRLRPEVFSAVYQRLSAFTALKSQQPARRVPRNSLRAEADDVAQEVEVEMRSAVTTKARGNGKKGKNVGKRLDAKLSEEALIFKCKGPGEPVLAEESDEESPTGGKRASQLAARQDRQPVGGRESKETKSAARDRKKRVGKRLEAKPSEQALIFKRSRPRESVLAEESDEEAPSCGKQVEQIGAQKGRQPVVLSGSKKSQSAAREKKAARSGEKMVCFTQDGELLMRNASGEVFQSQTDAGGVLIRAGRWDKQKGRAVLSSPSGSPDACVCCPTGCGPAHRVAVVAAELVHRNDVPPANVGGANVKHKSSAEQMHVCANQGHLETV